MPTMLQKLVKSFEECYRDISLTEKLSQTHLYIEKNNVLSSRKISGLDLLTESFSGGVKIKIIIRPGIKISQPIFLCFSVLKTTGIQKIIPEIILEENSQAQILAHCFFPKAKDVRHQMRAKIKINHGASLSYQETHYHGNDFGAVVEPKLDILVGPGAFFENKFILSNGTVGRLDVELKVHLQEKAIADVFSKVVGRGNKDEVNILDKIILDGPKARSLVKMKGVAVNGGKLFFQGETYSTAVARRSRGHIDCQEIVVGKKSIASSVPIIKVENSEARITHEAAVGRIDQKALETLMVRGLSENEAIDFVIRGAMK